MAHFVLTVRIHGDGLGVARFHGMSQGAPEWPPAPGRVFQALVAGVARGGIAPKSQIALRWLESLAPPRIAAPRRGLGQAVSFFVPNNDADSLADPRDVSSIRSKKIVQPSLFDGGVPIIYAWNIGADDTPADELLHIASELYQLGRGVDAAWAVGEVLDDTALDERLAAHPGLIHDADPDSRGERMLACPLAGTLSSLEERHRSVRLRMDGNRTFFVNAPKARFQSVSYRHAHRRFVLELRDRVLEKPWPWALDRAVKLVERVRDGAASRLRDGLPDRQHEIERVLIGRKPDGRDAGPAESRVRIVPLPSIGSEWADHAIRRLLVEVPTGAEVDAADVAWALSGLEWPDSSLRLVQTADEDMLGHFLGPARRWRSITPVALPESAKRRRIEPSRQRAEAKGAGERGAEESRAIAAVRDALRHSGLREGVLSIHVRREPFEGRGSRAESFAKDTRFAKERLWHVELEFERTVRGPLVIGDGRFLGLGVMAPRSEVAGVVAFDVVGEVSDAPQALARALRRAVMARVQAVLGERARLSPYFSGHAEGGGKARGERSSHLGFHWHGLQRRLVVLSPDRLDRRRPDREEERNFATLLGALDEFNELRAGFAGRCFVRRASVTEGDLLLSASRTWKSATAYTVTRHLKKTSPASMVELDVVAECERRGLPRPKVKVTAVQGIPGRGVEAILELEFAVAIEGPVVLGRTRYLGGGLFVPS